MTKQSKLRKGSDVDGPPPLPPRLATNSPAGPPGESRIKAPQHVPKGSSGHVDDDERAEQLLMRVMRKLDTCKDSAKKARLVSVVMSNPNTPPVARSYSVAGDHASPCAPTMHMCP